MSIWNSKLRLQFPERRPCGLHPAFFSCGNAETDRLDGFELLQPIQDLLVTARVLNYEFSSSVHSEDDRPVRLLHPVDEFAGIPFEVREGMNILP